MMSTMGSKWLASTVCAAAMLVPAIASTSDTAPYSRVLERFVSPDGLVDYAGLKADATDLDSFVGELVVQDRATYESWSREEQVAFWLNAYNALTLKAIVDHYPIEARGLARLRFPASSIRQIPAVWTAADHAVMGEEVSLEHIEHQVLRREFDEPRIHMALVCAALGCPPLRREPFVGARLDEQLDDQARRYLASPAGLRTEGERRVSVSEIFKWFASDFESYADRGAGFDGVDGFLLRFAPAPAAKLLRRRQARRSYIDYDWTLNDQSRQ